MSTTNENLGANRELEEAWFNEGETKVSSFEEIRKTIAQRKPYHYLPLSVSAEENSTIFLAIYEERAANRISAEEASTLQREYFETLDPSESAPDVFMDILAAKSKGWITAEEAALAIDNIVLDKGDYDVYSDLIESLAKEAKTYILPISPREKNSTPLYEKTEKIYQGPSRLQQYFSRKALLATAAVLSIGAAVAGVAGGRNQTGGSIKETVPAPAAPAKKAVTQTVEVPPKIQRAPQPTIEIAPKIQKEPEEVAEIAPKAQKSPSPVAEIAPEIQKAPASPTVPVITKTNSSGKTTLDQSKCIMAWKKMGYSVGIRDLSEGKVFVLKNEEGQKFIVSQENIQPGQEVIEAKPERKI